MKTKKSLLAISITAASLPLMALIAGPAMAQSTAELERRIEALEAQLNDVRSGQAPASGKDEIGTGQAPESDTDDKYVVTDGKGLRIGDTTVAFGGYVKADLIVGSHGDGTLNAYSVGLPRSFAALARNDDSSWETGFSARETRFSFGTSTEDVLGHTMTTYLEMDFNDAQGSNGNEIVSNSYNPRLRQAYGMWNGITAGQTYTTFSDLAALPEILNQGKHAAFIYAVQPMVRYTMPMPGGNLMMALENPEDGIGNTDNPDYDDQSIPDIVARYNLRGSYGLYSVSGMVRRLEVADDETWTGAVSVAARIPVGKNDIRLKYSYGGLGRYMGLYSYPDIQPADLGVGEADAFIAYGATAAYRHFWTPAWRSNLVLSHAEAVTDTATAGSLGLDASTSVHTNLLWSPHPKMTYGIEYAYWDFKTPVTGDTDDYQQVILSAKYDF